MSNLLNTILTNQLTKPVNQVPNPAFTFDSDGKVKPLSYKGKLLPSRIFASPKEYVQDLKQDILSIGKAAKGQANDYELGRINDVAMKLGSLGLASYLFVKNPLKLDKAMQFIGFGTFFGGMALWPKLAIQLPLRARTGVDIHQKYVDSQGRKKMLHQDPQYDLTDLYTREDLDKMGKKMKVDENLPDRDNFIKQRAKKTAIQGNTLWMMSSFVTPILSAMGCKVLEKPVGNLIEVVQDKSTLRKFEKEFARLSSEQTPIIDEAFKKFLQDNADEVLDNTFIEKISKRILDGSKGLGEIAADIPEQLKQLRDSKMTSGILTKDNIAKVLRENQTGIITKEQIEAAIKSLSDSNVEAAINTGSASGVVDALAKAVFGDKKIKVKQFKQAVGSSIQEIVKHQAPKLSAVADDIQNLNSSLSSFSRYKKVLDEYILARVGENAGSYNARHWNRMCTKLLKSLKLSSKELARVANGDMDVINDKLAKLAKDEDAYAKFVTNFVEMLNKYEAKVGTVDENARSFIGQIKQKAGELCSSTSKTLQGQGFDALATRVHSDVAAGTLEKSIVDNAKQKVVGAQSSLYRLLLRLELNKQNDKHIEMALKNAWKEISSTDIDEKAMTELIKVIKNIINNATGSDWEEKLTTAGFGLTKEQFKAVTKVIFEQPQSKGSGVVAAILEEDKVPEVVRKMLSGYEKYKQEMVSKVVNFENPIRPDLAGYKIGDAVKSSAGERSNLVGSTICNTLKKQAKTMKNTRNWTKLFGITLAVVTAATLLIGLTFGRKNKMEKQAEQESKING